MRHKNERCKGHLSKTMEETFGWGRSPLCLLAKIGKSRTGESVLLGLLALAALAFAVLLLLLLVLFLFGPGLVLGLLDGALVVLVAAVRASDTVFAAGRSYDRAIIPGADLDFGAGGIDSDISRFGFRDLDDFSAAIDLHANLGGDRSVADFDDIRPANEQVAAQNGLLEDDRIHRHGDDAARVNLTRGDRTGDVDFGQQDPAEDVAGRILVLGHHQFDQGGTFSFRFHESLLKELWGPYRSAKRNRSRVFPNYLDRTAGTDASEKRSSVCDRGHEPPIHRR